MEGCGLHLSRVPDWAELHLEALLQECREADLQSLQIAQLLLGPTVDAVGNRVITAEHAQQGT
jgi:hypothetical protein